jgi:hypothetical protein
MDTLISRNVLLPHLARLREQLAAIHPDVESDERLLTDVLDGETDSLDVLRSIARSAIEQETLMQALNARINVMRQRRDRLEAHAEACRATVRDGLAELGLKKLEDPEFSIALRPAPAKVLVTDIDALPAVYRKVTVEPRLSAIGKELRAGETVAGAELSNGGPAVLAISRS